MKKPEKTKTIEKSPQEYFSEIETEIRRTAAAAWRDTTAEDEEAQQKRMTQAMWLNGVLRKTRANYLGPNFIAIHIAEGGA